MNIRSEEIEQAKVVVYPPCTCCGSTTHERRADKRLKSGWSSYCRPCANKKSLEWKRDNQARQIETTTAWRKANPDRVKASRLKSIDAERKAALDWRHNNLERARKNDKAWRENNPVKARLKDQKRRAMKIEATRGPPITKDTIDELLRLQHELCAYCEKPLGIDYHIDHFVPLAKGGEHSSDNLLLACKKCNLRKGSKHPLTFMQQAGSPQMPKTSEAKEQSLVVIWSYRKEVRDMMPGLRWLHHSPNGEKRDVRTGNKLKAMGVKRGFPDLILPVNRMAGSNLVNPGLVIEMKSDKGRPTAEQDEWLNHFVSQGWVVGVARSAEEARSMLCLYLGLDPAKAPPLDRLTPPQ